MKAPSQRLAPRCPVNRSRVTRKICDGSDHAVMHCPECDARFVWPASARGRAEAPSAERRIAETEEMLARFPEADAPLYVLDLECGNGVRLAAAAARGWKCFGVEADSAARATAIERCGDKAEIVAEVGELIPHRFDLILMFDILERVADPYALMFGLFNAGAIAPQTRLVLTTVDGEQDDTESASRIDCTRPAVDLVHHTTGSLTQWLTTLKFERIDIERRAARNGRPAGLFCEAEGSRFYDFMLERYVPGTWSKLAEYEHVPRYRFARRFADGARVLDFGCGTGYGSRVLADAAEDVLGLDIDQDALAWAGFWHDRERLRFERHDDLGVTLPAASFDLVTCFEMIEHVDHATQQATVASLARLTAPDGKLLISTPNPEVTANYGANPYHLREMTEAQFIELLAPHFAHVSIYRQWMRPSVLIGTDAIPSDSSLASERLNDERFVDEPPAFIAVCSHRPMEALEPFCTFDTSFDMVLAETRVQKAITGLRFDNYLLREARGEANHRIVEAQREAAAHAESSRLHAEALARQEATIATMHASFDEQASSISSLRNEFDEQGRNIDALHQSLRDQAAALEKSHEHAVDREAALGAHVESLAEQARTIAGMRAAFDEQARNIDALHETLRERTASLQAAHEHAVDREAVLRSHVESLAQQEQTIGEMRAAFDEQASNIDELRRGLAAAHGETADRDNALRVAREHSQQQSTEHAEALRGEAEARERARAAHEETLAALQSVIERQALAQVEADRDLAAGRQKLQATEAALAERDEQLANHAARTLAAESLVSLRTAESAEWVGRYRALEMTRFVRLARILHGNSGSRAPLVEAIYLIVGGLVPRSVKAKLAPVAARLRARFSKQPGENGGFAPYRIKAPENLRASRPRVLHVIANFMTGGSSRLVVDLIERLGPEYEQKILTSFTPSPVHYVGADLTEIRDIDDTATMRAFVVAFDPHIVHVHYWGDCDEPWYRAVFGVTAEHGCPIVQNINTPVAPFTEAKLARNVFVSRYVLDHFGEGKADCTVIYPGSDFTLFAPSRRPRRAQGCIGMVYRLERDKLDEFAIEPFIEAARVRPGLKCLIVGGGSLLDHFVARVHAEGLDDAFEFTGYVSYSSLPALYKRMDVFVAPIWKESFGQVSAFAMNMGIPVVGYDVGAIPEIIADPSLVAPARDAAALAAIAVGLVGDDAARASIGIANRKRAGRMFSVDAMIRSYRELYRDVMRHA